VSLGWASTGRGTGAPRIGSSLRHPIPEEPLLEVDPTRMCELLVGLPDVIVLGVDDIDDGAIVVHIELAGPRSVCLGCSQLAVVKDRETVELIDLAYGGRASRLRWRKVRRVCRNDDCDMITWTWDDTRIGFPRQALTQRAARWVTVQVGRYGRSVSEVADELGCSWPTVNDAVISYGEALVDDDPGRVGPVSALGLDEALFCRRGPLGASTGLHRLSTWPKDGCSMCRGPHRRRALRLAGQAGTGLAGGHRVGHPRPVRP
jgi:hypothetical protein